MPRQIYTSRRGQRQQLQYRLTVHTHTYTHIHTYILCVFDIHALQRLDTPCNIKHIYHDVVRDSNCNADWHYAHIHTHTYPHTYIHTLCMSCTHSATSDTPCNIKYTHHDVVRDSNCNTDWHYTHIHTHIHTYILCVCHVHTLQRLTHHITSNTHITNWFETAIATQTENTHTYIHTYLQRCRHM